MISAIADQPWLIVAAIGGLMLGYLAGFFRGGWASRKILKRALAQCVYRGELTTEQTLQVIASWNQEAQRPRY